jgi:ectoine hydroxylase-related dioxygenase (phytanoyl-CoA dioxygenase family)
MDWHAEIEEKGFAFLPDLVPHNEVDRLIEQVGASVSQRNRAGLRHALKLPPVADLAQHPSLIKIARCVLGSEAFPFRATLFDKSQTANWLVVWHQDTALPLQCRRELPGWGPWSVKDGIAYAHAPASALQKVVALRVSLDDSTDKNGPLRVLPGTHKMGVLNDDVVYSMAEQISPVNCISPKGGVVAMKPLLIHSSSKSRADIPRRVLHIEYAASRAIANPLQLAVA